MIEVGARVQVVDHGDEHHGQHGTVTVGEHRGILTGRLMVQVRIDGLPDAAESGYYVEQVEEQFSLRAAS